MIKTYYAESALIGPELELKNHVLISVEDKKIVRIAEGVASAADYAFDGILMPGMIDSHAHLALDARIPGHLEKMEDPDSKQTLRALRSVLDDLDAGITGLRSLGDRSYIDVLLRDLIDKDAFAGPWLQVAGIGMKGLHGHGYVGKGFSGVEEFRRQCRENIFNHVDWLKIFITAGAPPLAPKTHVNCYLSREEVHTVIEESHGCGLKTSAHCIGGLGLRYCAEEGIDTLEHCYWATDEDIDLIKKHDTQVCFTSGVFMDESRLPLCPPSHADAVHKTRDEVVRRLARLVEAKPRFVLGSDAYHGLLYREVEWSVALGMDRKEAVKGVTVYGGDLAENLTGQLSPGYHADMICVAENPLQVPSALSRVLHVMKNGKMIR